MRDMTSAARGLLVSFAMLGAVSASAVADEVPDGYWRAPPVGTLLEKNFGQSCRVIAVEDDSYVCKGDLAYLGVRDTTWTVYRGLEIDTHAFNGSKRAFDKRKVDELFPLKVGNTTTFTLETGGDVYKYKYKVSSIKTIQTLLGPRTVFGITFTETGQTNDYKGKGWNYLDAELGFLHSGRLHRGEQ